MSSASLHDLIVSDHVDLATARVSGREVLPYDGFKEAEASITSWSSYAPTPVHNLPGLARSIGVAEVFLKDEGDRFGLGSFKALGGAYAVLRLFADEVAAKTGTRPTEAQLAAGRHPAVARDLVVTCTTDGNHGRSVAWGARRVGCRCVIYVHKGVTEARAEAIRALGAEVVRAGASYDESVELNARDAAAHGWHVVADTDVSEVTAATVAIMQGYRVMVEELLDDLDQAPTHVFLQVGCGGFAAAVVAHMLSRLDEAICFIGVEPETAACLAPSIETQQSAPATGDLETIMAGLSVGHLSWPAWKILANATAAVAVVPDQAAVTAMRLLADGIDGDPKVVSGESGAAGLAGLLAIVADEAAREALHLDQSSRVLLVNTEGATDPEAYEHLVGVGVAFPEANKSGSRNR